MSTPQEKLHHFFKQYPEFKFAPNQTVLAAGSANTALFYVEEGAIKMSKTIPGGKNVHAHICFSDSFFSLFSLLNNDANQYDFITITPATVRRVPKTELVSFLQANNDVLFLVQTRLLRGMQGLLKRIESGTLTDAHSQVASIISYFAKHFLDTNNSIVSSPRISVRITHQEIADWLGLSRENVSIQMKQLEKDAVIKMDKRRIVITNPTRLSELAATSALV